MIFIYRWIKKKKNESKVCSALSRVLGARITRVAFVLSLPLSLCHRLLPHDRFVGHPLRVTSFVLNRFGGFEMQYPVESARHSSRPTWLVETVWSNDNVNNSVEIKGGEGDEFCRRIIVRSGKFSTSTTIAILAPLNVICFVGDSKRIVYQRTQRLSDFLNRLLVSMPPFDLIPVLFLSFPRCSFSLRLDRFRSSFGVKA